jgi:aspartate racemase
MHKVFAPVRELSPIPLISIVDGVKDAVLREGMDRVALLGTIFTMQDDFFIAPIARQGIDVAVPSKKNQEQIQKIIETDLTLGHVTVEAKKFLHRIVSEFEGAGVQGVILGCTEIPLVLSQEEYQIRLFDSTRLHAESALEYSLS